MTVEKLEFLRDELARLRSAADYLGYSLERCRELIERDSWTPDELERLESLSSRFAREADLATQRIMRLVDDLELVTRGSLLDRIHRAEQRGWCQAAELIRIRELRNPIAHEYADERMAEIYAAVAQLAPEPLIGFQH